MEQSSDILLIDMQEHLSENAPALYTPSLKQFSLPELIKHSDSILATSMHMINKGLVDEEVPFKDKVAAVNAAVNISKHLNDRQYRNDVSNSGQTNIIIDM